MHALRGSQRFDRVAYSSETTAKLPAASENTDVTEVLDVVSDQVLEPAHGVCTFESELCTAVENGRGFHVNLLVDAEQGVAGHFGPLASDVFVVSVSASVFVADRRNPGLDAARPLVFHTRP